MATITKKKGKWFVQIRRSFHKPIYKTFVAKPDAYRWSRETERLIEIGQFVDTTEANKTTLRTLLERYEREVVPKKRTTGDKYLISNIMKHSFVDKVESEIQQRKYKDISEEAAGTVRLVNLYLHYALCIYKLPHIQNDFARLIWNVVKKKNILFY